MGLFMEPVMPVTWKNGKVASCTVLAVLRFQKARCTAVAITLR